MKIMFVIAATGAGAAAGWACGLIPVWPGARLAAAAIIGSLVVFAGVLAFVVLTLNRSGGGGLGAVSFGASEVVLLGIATFALIALVGYVALRRLGWSPASLASYGTIVLGGGAALITALWVTRSIVISGGS